MSSNCRIREAAAADAQAIVDCLHAAFAPYRDRYTPAAYSDTTLDGNTIHDRLRTMTLFVALHDGAIVGTVGCQISDGEGHLRGMAVLPAWQGSGVARMLLEAAERKLAAAGVARVTLDTTGPLQRAARFYEKCGYRRTGASTDFFGMSLAEFEKILERPFNDIPRGV